MASISREQVYQLARLAGLELDDQRADSIAERLRAVLDELDAIPAEALAEAEPSLVFVTQGEAQHG
jgi:Asp-tRNA(Asn)/Glu-tRNA(Gln) amidotransferase C subunit